MGDQRNEEAEGGTSASDDAIETCSPAENDCPTDIGGLSRSSGGTMMVGNTSPVLGDAKTTGTVSTEAKLRTYGGP
jgi:hypothetical protein